MRILLTGIPSYLQRTVASVSGTEVRHRPYFDDIRTKAELIEQVRKIANTGNYLIGEGAAYSLKAHDVTYVPFWHLARSCGSEDVYERLNQEFDICVFASANLLRPGYSADLEAEVFEKLKMPVVVMGIGIQRKEGLKENLPAGTLKFLDVLRRKESFFLTRGYFTAEFLKEQGMKFVKPTGCPSLYFNPAGMQRSLAALANPELAQRTEDRLRRLPRQRRRYDRRCACTAEADERRKLCRAGRVDRLQPVLVRRRSCACL